VSPTSGSAPEIAVGLARFVAVRVAFDGLRGAPLTRALMRRLCRFVVNRFVVL